MRGKINLTGAFTTTLMFFMLAAVSLDPLFFRPSISYKVYLFFLIAASLALFSQAQSKISESFALRGLLFVLAAASASAGQYLFSFHRKELVVTAAMLMALAFVLTAVFSVMERRDREATGEPPLEIPERAEKAAVFGIFLMALLLRAIALDKLPLGIWFDEAQNGLETLALMRSGEVTVFIPRFTQMPSMYFYLSAFFVKVFGPNIVSLRLVSAALGSLSVVAFYFLARLITRDVFISLLAAFLLAVTRWHINFSRLAFLGTQTVLLECVVLYFYLRMVRSGNRLDAVLSGFSAGLALYTFSAANLLPVIIALHAVFVLFGSIKKFFRVHLLNYVLLLAVLLVTAAPLLDYARKNYAEFTQRIKDVSIQNDIQREKSLAPVIRNIKNHFLMFNYHGDYNGRHNYYQKPMVDSVTGVLLPLGLFLAATGGAPVILFIWFIVMLSAGIATATIEAPQAYRILCIVPAICLLSAYAVKKITGLLSATGMPKRAYIVAFLVVLSAGAINLAEYFVFYPKEKASFMDFSPEANGVSRLINSKAAEYYLLVSEARGEHGFAYWEQKQIVSFDAPDREGRDFDWMQDKNEARADRLAGKKGVALVVRESDTKYIEEISKTYPKAVKEEFKNPFNGAVLYICYYIDTQDISTKPGLLYRPAN